MKDTINILIVDDIQANIYATEVLLESLENITTHQALSVKEALSILLNNKIDLILSDVHMPEINGFEFAKILKKNNKTKDIPFIFMTAAYLNERAKEHGYKLGAIEYITKPISPTVLKLKLSKYIHMFQVNKKLEEQKRFTNQILEASEDAKMIIDENCTLVDYNQKIFTIFASILDQENVVTFLDKQGKDNNELQKFKKYLVEHRKNTITTHTLFYNENYYKIFIKNVSSYKMVMFYDITEEIKKTKRKDAIFNSHQSIIVVTDGVQVHDINSIFFQEYGFENLKDFKSKYNCICDLFVSKEGHDYLMPTINGLRWNNYINLHPEKTHEALLINKDGLEKIYEVKSSGNLFGITEIEEVVSFYDVTEIKNKNKLLIQHSKQAAMGEMISMIAHQWRQPLASIGAITSKMKLKHELDMLTPQNFLDDIEKTSMIVKHLSKTIDTFQDYLKEKNGQKIKIISMWHNLNNIIDSLLHNKDIRHVFTYNNEETLIDDRLDQVFLNIYQNAIDALNTMNHHKEKLIKTTITKNEENKVEILICDNAGGISVEILEKIFVPYFSTKSKNGSGLGLYMSKEIVENIGGNLEVYNYEEGACFKVTI